MGYFSYRRFVAADGSGRMIDEIALNPEYFRCTRLLKSCKRWFMSSAICGSTTTATRRVRRTTMRSGRQNGKYRTYALLHRETRWCEVSQKINDYPIHGGRFQRRHTGTVRGQFALSWFDRFLSGRTTKRYDRRNRAMARNACSGASKC